MIHFVIFKQFQLIYKKKVDKTDCYRHLNIDIPNGQYKEGCIGISNLIIKFTKLKELKENRSFYIKRVV